jgi:hypothetical protein
VVGRQVRGLPGEADGEAQLEEAEAVGRGDGAQTLGALAVEGRVAVDEHAHQPRQVLLVNRVQGELHAVGQKLLELRFDGVGDAAQAADEFALARRLARQARRARRADADFIHHALQLVARALDEAQLLGRRGRVLARRQARVQTAQAPPRAQVLLLVARAQLAWVLDREL